MDKQVWLDMVVELRTAQECGTIGTKRAIEYNDPQRDHIHQQVKEQAVIEFSGWISAPDGCKERE